MRKTKHDKETGTFIRQLDYDVIAGLYSEGKSYSEISHIMKCSSTAVQYALKQMGIEARSKTKTKKKNKHDR